MNRTLVAAMAMAVALVVAAGSQAQTSGQSSGQSVQEIDAVTAARHDLKLGFTVPGKVLTTPVKAGDVVEKGQILMDLDDREGQVMVERLKLRIGTDAEVRAREERLKFARLKEAQVRQLLEKSAASNWELQTAEVETRIAELELELAVQTHEDLGKQLEQAEAKNEQFILRAPAAGVVEQVTVEEGELVESLKPVVRLVVTDPLWIDVAVPVHQTLSLHVNGPAWVRSKLPGRDEPMLGKIIHLAAVSDAASDTRLVRVEVPNPDHLPAGGHVTIAFEQPGLAAAGPNAVHQESAQR